MPIARCFPTSSETMPIIAIIVCREGLYTYFASTICHFARCIKLKVKLFFIHHFLRRRLLTRIILILGHTIGRLTDLNTVTTKNIEGFWDEFGYGKYLIVPIWYASAAYQPRSGWA